MTNAESDLYADYLFCTNTYVNNYLHDLASEVKALQGTVGERDRKTFIKMIIREMIKLDPNFNADNLMKETGIEND